MYTLPNMLPNALQIQTRIDKHFFYATAIEGIQGVI